MQALLKDSKRIEDLRQAEAARMEAEAKARAEAKKAADEEVKRAAARKQLEATNPLNLFMLKQFDPVGNRRQSKAQAMPTSMSMSTLVCTPSSPCPYPPHEHPMASIIRW